MDLTRLSPDELVYWEWGFVKINATIAWTWGVMVLMILFAWLVTRRLSTTSDISRSQNAMEVVVEYIRDQIREISGGEKPNPYLPFVGTLFLFIAVANLLTIVPGYVAPTASLSTTAALAIAVFLAVPVYGVVTSGWRPFLRHYVEPSPVMLPFNVMGDLSRTLALAVRLFGNVMSGTKIVAVLVAIIPLLFPIVFRALGLLTGLIQAYIFAVLAMVYIASGTTVTEPRESDEQQQHDELSGAVRKE
ncbi:MAG: F0F1 ATP synthase subunit A [Actinomycetota bacterium]